MKIIALALALLTIQPLMAIAPVEHGSLNQQQLQTYFNSLQDQIQQQQKRVDALLQKMRTNKTAPAMVDKMALENAITVLDVKKTLYGNFAGTESLNNPEIRQKLLQIFTQEDISTGDLAILQGMVNSYKQSLHAPQPTP